MLFDDKDLPMADDELIDRVQDMIDKVDPSSPLIAATIKDFALALDSFKNALADKHLLE